MTDPASALALTNICINLALNVGGLGSRLRKILEMYQDAPTELQLLRSQVNVTQRILNHLSSALKQSYSVFQRHADCEALKDNLHACEFVAGVIEKHIGKVQPDSDSRAGRWQRVQHLWDRDAMQENERRLNIQVSSLGVFLQALQLNSPSEQVQVLQDAESKRKIGIARGHASSYMSSTSVSASMLSGASSTEIPFDEILAKSVPYRRQLRSLDMTKCVDKRKKLRKRSESSPELLVSSPNVSIKQSLLSRVMMCVDGSGALHLACQELDRETVRILVQKGVDVNRRVGNMRQTALHVVAGSRAVKKQPKFDLDLIRILLIAGATVDSRDAGYMTPLHYAARWCSAEVVQTLLNAGAETNADAIKTQPNIEKHNSGYTWTWNPLHNAAETNNEEAMRILLDAGAVVDAAEDIAGGVTPLFAACWYGSLESLTLLLQYGADVNKTDHFGWTALHWVARQSLTMQAPNRHILVLDKLLKAGAYPNSATSQGLTPLHVAIAHRQPLEFVQLLCQASTDAFAICHKYVEREWPNRGRTADKYQLQPKWAKHIQKFSPVDLALCMSDKEVSDMLQKRQNEWQIIRAPARPKFNPPLELESQIAKPPVIGSVNSVAPKYKPDLSSYQVYVEPDMPAAGPSSCQEYFSQSDVRAPIISVGITSDDTYGYCNSMGSDSFD